jgi:hypothetical protein
VDHLNTMAIPYYGQWQDADQSGGSTFLPYFTDSVEVTSPEYFVPEGIAYQPCMTYGGCSDALLDDIYRAEMTMSVYFYSVTPVTGEMVAVPLRMVGPDWSVGQTLTQPMAAGARRVWLPLVSRQISPPPFDPTKCPCGWFTADGRMIGFVPQPDQALQIIRD